MSVVYINVIISYQFVFILFQITHETKRIITCMNLLFKNNFFKAKRVLSYLMNDFVLNDNFNDSTIMLQSWPSPYGFVYSIWPVSDKITHSNDRTQHWRSDRNRYTPCDLNETLTGWKWAEENLTCGMVKMILQTT